MSCYVNILKNNQIKVVVSNSGCFLNQDPRGNLSEEGGSICLVGSKSQAENTWERSLRQECILQDEKITEHSVGQRVL